MLINLTYQNGTDGVAPALIQQAMQTAANLLDGYMAQSINITVNIPVYYGQGNGHFNMASDNESIGGALSGEFASISYSALRNDLLASSDIDWASSSLANASSLNGNNTFGINNAQRKLFGLLAANGTENDGEVDVGTVFANNPGLSQAALFDEAVSMGIHEIGHALGRQVGFTNLAGNGGFSLDIFRFSSLGQRVFASSGTPQSPAAASYWSMDNGATHLADFGRTSDAGDFLNTAGIEGGEVQSSNLTPNDPNNEAVGTLGAITNYDVMIMDALGFGQSAAWTASGAIIQFGDVTGGGVASDIVQFEPNGNVDVLTGTGNSYTWPAHWTSGSRPGDLLGNVSGASNANRWDIVEPSENGNIYVWTSNGSNGFNNYTVWGHGARPSDILADVNADGKKDLIEPNENGNIYVWTSTGTAFNNYTIWGHGTRPGDISADVTGNGRADLVEPNENGNIYVWTSTGTAFNNYTVWGSGGRPGDVLADVSGDGKADLVEMNENGNIYVWTSTGAAFNNYTVWGHGARPGDHLADVTGDGKTDVVETDENGNAYVWTSTGSSFNNYSIWATGCNGSESVQDVNGDGKADLVQFDGNGRVYVALSTGTSFGSWQAWGQSPGDTTVTTPPDFGTSDTALSAAAAGNSGNAANASLLTNYMASSFAGSAGMAGSASVIDAGQSATTEPLLTHPQA